MRTRFIGIRQRSRIAICTVAVDGRALDPARQAGAVRAKRPDSELAQGEAQILKHLFSAPHKVRRKAATESPACTLERELPVQFLCPLLWVTQAAAVALYREASATGDAKLAAGAVTPRYWRARCLRLTFFTYFGERNKSASRLCYEATPEEESYLQIKYL